MDVQTDALLLEWLGSSEPLKVFLCLTGFGWIARSTFGALTLIVCTSFPRPLQLAGSAKTQASKSNVRGSEGADSKEAKRRKPNASFQAMNL